MSPSWIARLALLLACLAPLAARADVEDLSTGKHPGSRGTAPAMIVVRAQGGTDYSPFGIAGGALSYYNDFSGLEIEGGLGSGLPGLQFGFTVGRLWGEGNDFLCTSIGVGFNKNAPRGTNPVIPNSGNTVWTNLGVGFEHRSWVSLQVMGGLTFLGFAQSPSGFLQGGLGIGW